MNLSDDFLRMVQSADIAPTIHINDLAAAAHARMKLAFEHDRRSLAQRLRRDRVNKRGSNEQP